MPDSSDISDELDALRSVKEEAAATLDCVQSEVGKLREQLGRMAAALDRAERLLTLLAQSDEQKPTRKRREHSRPNRATPEQRARLSAVHLAGGTENGSFVSAQAIANHLASPMAVGDLHELLQEQARRGHLEENDAGDFRLSKPGNECRVYQPKQASRSTAK